jgi:glycine betaine/proline transport system ATP-binding protein
MQDILPQVASSSWPVPVVDDQNVYKGVVSKNRFLKNPSSDRRKHGT